MNPATSSLAPVVTVIDRPVDMQHWSGAQRRSGRTVALVPTMGALHAGHLALVDEARNRADRVVVSIFVNPLQFGESSDFEHYPRPIDDDIAACASRGVDVVYAPTAAAMYPPSFATTVHIEGITEVMEGVSRPGHFDGVTTVVAKLLAASGAHLAVFGEKDFQQLAVVRQMVADLDLGVDIVGHPTMREPDGVAMSSRNRRLSVSERAAASCIPRAIDAAATRAAAADATPAGIAAAAARIISDEPLARVDYVNVFDSVTLHSLDSLDADRRRVGRTRIGLAVSIGDVRLIDNADLFDRRGLVET